MHALLSQIPFEAREHFTDLGRQFGWDDTLAQAEQTLEATDRFGAELVDHGFIQDDISRLRAARDALSRHGGTAAASGKRTSVAYVEAVRAGKTARQCARSILHIVAQRLAYSGDPMDVEAARAAAATLSQTESSRGDPVRLATQLHQLRAALSMPRIDRVADPRGGLSACAALQTAAESLRAAAQHHNLPLDSEPSEAEQVDMLVGIIVELVRDARRAARSAARAKATPEIAAEFELTRLYGQLDAAILESERPPPLG